VKRLKLHIATDRRSLSTEDNNPFFWLGDTAWELFHRLTREEIDHYLETRLRQGFNVVQAVALAERDGLRVPNAYGRRPLLVDSDGNYDPTQPDVAGEGHYWDHVDYGVRRARELGLYVALVPTWGDKYYLDAWGRGPIVFTPQNARAYGAWIGARYKDADHIIWVLGGDRVLLTRQHHEIINEMALGIRSAVGEGHLITFHPCGASSSSRHVHREPWLDFNMIQSGHRPEQLYNDDFVTHDWGLEPTKPTLDAEPRYEDHPIDFDAKNGYFAAADVRQAAYRSVFAGGFGVTYGHHSVWSFWHEGEEWPGKTAYVLKDWRWALERPGARQMCHLRNLMESRPLLGREPDSSLLVEDFAGVNRMCATRGDGYALVYSPCGLPFSLDLGGLGWGHSRAAWYDPRTGERHALEAVASDAQHLFVPPSSGRGEDWVLTLDAVG
jgi:Protein of unknown function (DUF4038)/Putative collagen-binding domain of a collagenase